MQIKALKAFSSIVLGNVSEGQTITTSEDHGKHLVANGMCDAVKPYKAKVVNAQPDHEGGSSTHNTKKGPNAKKTQKR